MITGSIELLKIAFANSKAVLFAALILPLLNKTPANIRFCFTSSFNSSLSPDAVKTPFMYSRLASIKANVLPVAPSISSWSSFIAID